MLLCTHFRKRTQIQIYHDSKKSSVNVEKEGQRRDRKRDRQKKQMTDNIVSPSLPVIRNQNH